jgi:CheY-like chemotaxis protein
MFQTRIDFSLPRTWAPQRANSAAVDLSSGPRGPGHRPGIRALLGGTNIDLLFSDTNFPGSDNGYTLASSSAKARSGVLMLLTSGQPEGPTACLKGPIRRFVRKPYELRQLVKLIHVLPAGSG